MTSCWHLTDILKTSRWHLADISLTFCWHLTGILLTFRWHLEDISLTSCWRLTDILLISLTSRWYISLSLWHLSDISLTSRWHLAGCYKWSTAAVFTVHFTSVIISSWLYICLYLIKVSTLQQNIQMLDACYLSTSFLFISCEYISITLLRYTWRALFYSIST